jgi:hypothetical protein
MARVDGSVTRVDYLDLGPLHLLIFAHGLIRQC